MFKNLLSQLKTGLMLVIMLTLLTGFIYPFLVTGLAQLFFPWQANGSLIIDKNRVVGSQLIGQPFTSPIYFWGRPSATMPLPYNGAASRGSNLGPGNPMLWSLVQQRINFLKETDPNHNPHVPVDLVTASASGLDPEISPLAALYQVPRIAKARNISKDRLEQLVNQQIQQRTLKILGEPRINVLELNIALDNLRIDHGTKPPQP